MGGGGQNTTTEKADPWYQQQPYLIEGYDKAREYMNNDVGLYPQTPITRNAIDTYRDSANSANLRQSEATSQEYAQGGYGSGYDRALGRVDDLSVTGSINPGAMGALSGLAGYRSDAQGLAALNGLAGYRGDAQGLATLGGLTGFQGDEQAGDYYRRAAAGDFLTQNNPYFRDVVDNSLAAARPSLDATFASSGRLGSGNYAAAMADSANRTASQLGYQDYTAERARQDAAAGALDSRALAAAGMRLNAGQGLLAQGNTAAGLQMNAGQGLLNQGNAAAGIQAAAAGQLGDLSAQDFQSRLAAATGASQGYKNDADFRMQAAGLLPSFDAARAEALSKAAGIEAADLERQNPWTNLERYWGIAGNNVIGGGRTSTSPGVDNTGAYVGAAASVAAAAAIAI